jgi:hypothetical protein
MKFLAMDWHYRISAFYFNYGSVLNQGTALISMQRPQPILDK